MNANRSSVWGGLMLLALGCELDRRTFSLIDSLRGDAGIEGDGGAAAPRLAVGPEALDLGWVSTGFPARARVQVSNRCSDIGSAWVGFGFRSCVGYKKGCPRQPFSSDRRQR